MLYGPARQSLEVLGVFRERLHFRNKEIKEPEVFTGLGTFGERYDIKLKDDATPHSLYAPRGIPMPLRDQVKEELERMQKLGVMVLMNVLIKRCNVNSSSLLTQNQSSGICILMQFFFLIEFLSKNLPNIHLFFLSMEGRHVYQ